MRKLKNPELELSKIQDSLEKLNQKKVRDSFTIRVVTPMIGGGAKPHLIDNRQPVRSSAIRGQLRFWWRATRGASCKDVAELRKREVEIFGSTDRPSPVKIRVETLSEIKSEKVFNEDSKNPKMARELQESQYALFPLRETVKEKLERETGNKGPKYINNFKFILHIEYALPELEEEECMQSSEEFKLEIECALWAWINFGGIGARTRRGCGSLYCSEFSPKTARANELRTWFQEKVEKYKLNLVSHEENFQQSYRDWSTLSTTIKFSGGEAEPVKAWGTVVKNLQDFRSARKEYEDSRCFSRSFWPEADSIRRITGKGVKDHLKSTTIKEGKDYIAFPRAQLGLPIVFHFRNDTKKYPPLTQGCEPSDTELVPKGRDRLASPIILKAVAVMDGTSAVSAVIVLNQPKLGWLSLRSTKKKNDKQQFKGKNIEPSAVYIAPEYLPERKVYNPMKVSGSQNNRFERVTDSAITAFLNWKEVGTWQWLNEN
ncbi:type III-B CRISPR module RAMP protein Cmr1 [Marinicrinis lubricantis]|uniref:Type III-B CRISPR module RAMP protein Cmr1 n=1 Tax=Marinicrinis lubricantis TaxID=2086470 RepID=A0ABW1INB4_9BACL